MWTTIFRWVSRRHLRDLGRRIGFRTPFVHRCHLDFDVPLVMLAVSRVASFAEFFDHRVTERERTAEISIYHHIIKVDELLGRLAGQSLLFSDQYHSQSLPDAPHDYHGLLGGLFETSHRSSLREK